MRNRRQRLLATLCACLLLLSGVGAGAASAAGAPTAADDAETNAVPQVQQTDETDNGTDELPVEPPTRAHPGYEYIKNENDTEAKIELGKQLYLDPRISQTGTISCNTCHNVMDPGGHDGRPTAMGVHGQTGPVNSPTVWNSGFHHTQFWDGRADTLAEQAKGPLVADVEMGMPDTGAVLERLRSMDGYVEAYQEVYGDQADVEDPEDIITLERTVDAIAAYERTLVTPNSPYDQYVQGDADALSEQQLDGMETFEELGCTSCHSGPMFSGQWDEPESGNGVYQPNPTYPNNEQCSEYVDEYGLMENPGRMGVTDDSADQYLYKVPTLRNVEYTAPYTHTGNVRTLEEMIRLMGACQLNQNLSDQQVQDIRAFLTSLSGEHPEQEMPMLPGPSGESVIPADTGLGPSETGGQGTEMQEAEGTEMQEAEGTEMQEGGSSGGIIEDTPGFTMGLTAVALALALATALIARTRRFE
jgi:cytochrome c peroxidase